MGSRHHLGQLHRVLRKHLLKIALVSLILVVCVGVALGAQRALLAFRTNTYVPAHYTGTAECLSYVRTIEGQALLGIPYLACKSSPAHASNSAIAIHHVEYYGGQRQRDTEFQPVVCAGSNLVPAGDGPCNPNYKTVGFVGYLLGDGSTYTDLEEQFWMGDTYDYCMDSTHDYPGHPAFTPPVKPTLQDLYMYQGQLWQRVVFKNVQAHAPFGTCTFNGTILYSYGRQPHEAITNLTDTYTDFPADCSDTVRGLTPAQATSCINFVIAAHATPYICGTAADLIYEDPTKFINDPTNLVVGIGTYDHNYKFKYEDSDNDGINGCNAVYEQRMAELNRCDEITNSAWRTRCVWIRTNPTGIAELTDQTL